MWEIIVIIALIAVVYYLVTRLNSERAMPKDNKRRPFSNDEKIKISWNHLRKHGPHCAHCSSTEDLDFDHVIPLSKPGGHNGLDNLQILCGRCNSKKGNRHSG